MAVHSFVQRIRPVCAFTPEYESEGRIFSWEGKSAPVRLGQERQSSLCNADALHEGQCPAEAAWRLKAANTSQPTSSVQETM